MANTISKIKVGDEVYNIRHEGGELKSSGFEVVEALPTQDLFTGRQVYFDGDTWVYNGTNWKPSTVQNYEANLKWGGANLVENMSPLDALVLSGNNILEFLDPSIISAQYSRDEGTTWVNKNLTNAQKIQLFGNAQDVSNKEITPIFYIGDTNSTTDSHKNRAKITIKAQSGNNCVLPTAKLKKLYIRVNNNEPPHTGWVTLRVRRAYWPEDQFVTVFERQPISGYPGWNVIQMDDLRMGPGTSEIVVYYQHWEFEFGITEYTEGQKCTLGIDKIFMIASDLYATKAWAYPENLTIRDTGHLYRYDTSKNAYFPAKVNATGFKAGNYDNYTVLLANGGIRNLNHFIKHYTSSNITTQSGYITKDVHDCGVFPIVQAKLNGKIVTEWANITIGNGSGTIYWDLPEPLTEGDLFYIDIIGKQDHV